MPVIQEGVRGDNKIARICWNTEEWRRPSGTAGKSTNRDAFERKFGFGHEEWLFDMTKLINGWHYAFIQPLGHGRSKYSGQMLDIALYAIDGKTKWRWWVGEISDAEVTDFNESKSVYAEYKSKGWLAEMEDQLHSVGASVAEFRRTRLEQFCAVRFRPNKVKLDLRRFVKDDISNSRYVLLERPSQPLPSPTDPFGFVPGHNEKACEAEAKYGSYKVNMDLDQNQWQTPIYNQLSKKFGPENVGTERPTTSGGQIDVVVKKNSEFTFYEIKTSHNVRLCIREALGQLLEYAYFPPPPGANRATQLVIVSSNVLTPEAECYLTMLRERFGLPIHYQRYDPDKNTLEGKLI